MKHTTMATPIGPLTMLLSDAGAVRAAGFTTDVADLLRLVHVDLRQEPEPGGAAEPGRRRSQLRPWQGSSSRPQCR